MSRDVVARLDDMIEAAEYVVAWTTGRVADDLADDVGLRWTLIWTCRVWWRRENGRSCGGR